MQVVFHIFFYRREGLLMPLNEIVLGTLSVRPSEGGGEKQLVF